MPPRVKPHLLALAVFTPLVFLSLGPVVPGSQIWGGEANDVINYLCTLVWQAREAGGGALTSWHTTMLLYPDGGAIWPPDLLGGLAMIPVVWLLGPVVAYALLVLADLVFACWAMFWLVRRLTAGDDTAGDTPVALMCGAVYGLAPVTLGHVNNGVMEQLPAGWLPLFVGALLALMDDARAPASPRRAALLVLGVAASWWAASVSSHWYHGVYAGVLFGLLLSGRIVHSWVVDRRVPLALLWRGAAALLLFAALVAPVALWFVSPYESAASLMRSLDAPTLHTAGVNADAAYLLAPRPPIKAGTESFMHVAYLGFTVPLLALLGLARAGRRRAVAAWLAMALLWTVLALGPRLVYGGQFVEAGGGPVSMPYGWLAEVVPLFGRMDFPYRCILVAHLCLAVAAGLGLGGLLPGSGGARRWRWAAMAAVAAVVWLETALLSGAPLPAPRRTVEAWGPVARLAAAGERSAVLDLPLRLMPSDSRRYAVNQLFHQRPIPYTSFITARTPFSMTLARRSLVINVLYMVSQPLPFPPEVPLHWEVFHQQMWLRDRGERITTCLVAGSCEAGLRQELDQERDGLVEQGFGHVVLHTDLLPAGSPLPAVCAALFGAPSLKQDRVWVYKLRSPAE